MLASLWSKIAPKPKVPTVVHVTHAKAGSTWIANILYDLLPANTAPRGRLVTGSTYGDLSKHHFKPGWIYPAMFMTNQEFIAHPELADARRLVVIRDPRDTIVSLYFSLKFSHPLDAEGKKEKERQQLQSLNLEEGLAFLIEQYLKRIAEIQTSWLQAGEPVYRYEELIGNPAAVRELLLTHLALPVSGEKVDRVLKRRAFESVFRRKLGEVNEASHGRQGLPGDWKNHFTPSLRRLFHEKHGNVLIAAGYESGDEWIECSA